MLSENYIFALIVVAAFVIGGAFFCCTEMATGTSMPSARNTAAVTPSFMKFTNPAELTAVELAISTSTQFHEFANIIFKLGEADNVRYIEEPGREPTDTKTVAENIAKLRKYGYRLLDFIPLVMKSECSERRQRWHSWGVYCFNIAGETAGNDFFNRYVKGLAGRIDRNSYKFRPEAVSIAEKLTSIISEPYPENELVLPGKAQEFIEQVSTFDEDTLSDALLLLYVEDMANEKWLRLIAKHYVSVDILNLGLAWIEGDGFKPASTRTRYLLLRALGYVPGGPDLLYSMYGNLIDDRHEKARIIIALANANYEKVIPIIKSIAGYVKPKDFKAGDKIDVYPDEQRTALRSLGFFKDKTIADYCLKFFKNNKDVEIYQRQAALEPYAIIMGEAAIDELASIFAADDIDVRVGVATALAKIKSRRALAFLDEICQFDPNENLRGHANWQKKLLIKDLTKDKK